MSNRIHPNFKWNNHSFSDEEWLRYAQNLRDSSNDFERDWAQFICDWLNDSDTLEVSTSGTTGTPKTIVVHKQAMIASAQATADFFQMYENSRALLCLPMKYIAGKMMMVRALTQGWHIDGVEPSNNPLLGITKSYDFVAMVPMQVEQALEQLELCGTIIIGGAPLNDMLRKKINAKNINAYETYGMTETLSHIALKKTSEDFFTSLPKVDISLDDRSCLVVYAPDICPTKLVTNDIVKRINDRQFMWKGRIDNIINSGGIKIQPELIEKKLHPLIKERFFVFGKPDNVLGEKVCLLIESTPYSIDLRIFDTLEKYEKPKKVFFCDSFFKTTTGKVKRKETAEQLFKKEIHKSFELED